MIGEDQDPVALATTTARRLGNRFTGATIVRQGKAPIRLATLLGEVDHPRTLV